MARVVAEFLEDLTLIDSPIAVEMRSALVCRQRLQLLDVVRICIHQHLVVADGRLNEDIVIRVFAVAEIAVDEDAFNVFVTDSARIHRVVASRLEVCARGTKRCADEHDPLFRELCCLLEDDEVKLLSLILQQVALVVAVAHHQTAAVGEEECPLIAVVLGVAEELRSEWDDMVIAQLGHCTAQQKPFKAAVAHT